MNWSDPHGDCELCTNCARHLIPEDQWPCLECGTPLCDTCDCPTQHITEACS